MTNFCVRMNYGYSTDFFCVRTNLLFLCHNFGVRRNERNIMSSVFTSKDIGAVIRVGGFVRRQPVVRLQP